MVVGPRKRFKVQTCTESSPAAPKACSPAQETHHGLI